MSPTQFIATSAPPAITIKPAVTTASVDDNTVLLSISLRIQNRNTASCSPKVNKGIINSTKLARASALPYASVVKATVNSGIKKNCMNFTLNCPHGKYNGILCKITVLAHICLRRNNALPDR